MREVRPLGVCDGRDSAGEHEDPAVFVAVRSTALDDVEARELLPHGLQDPQGCDADALGPSSGGTSGGGRPDDPDKQDAAPIQKAITSPTIEASPPTIAMSKTTQWVPAQSAKLWRLTP